uniref:Calcium-transporting ATPase n=1 Tax=Eutreptiella gymnastica TaxID=73025 RepID=A0A7S4FDS7_9EUGL
MDGMARAKPWSQPWAISGPRTEDVASKATTATFTGGHVHRIGRALPDPGAVKASLLRMAALLGLGSAVVGLSALWHRQSAQQPVLALFSTAGEKSADADGPEGYPFMAMVSATAAQDPANDDSAYGGLEREGLYRMIERKDVDKLKGFGGVHGLLTKLQSDIVTGIDSASVKRRELYFGPNRLPEQDPVTFWGLVRDELGDTMLQILMGAAVVSLILGLTVPDPSTGEIEYATGWIEGAAILASVGVVTFVSAWNNYDKALKFAELNKQTAKKEVSVVRDGKRTRVDIAEVVVGDVLRIGYGDILGADGVYVAGEDIICDESAQTGESEPINKGADKDPFFLAGGMVTQGGGEMLVTGVGESSCEGKLSAALEVEKSETPLQEKLEELANTIGMFGLYAAVTTFGVLSLKELYMTFGLHAHAFYIKPFLDFLIVAVTIVVVAIPEGLPLAVTISLAYSMKQMQRDNCLVRVLAACETMGGANTICSDKTGTLTTNRMSVVQGYIGEQSFDLTPPHGFDFATVDQGLLALLCESVSLNSTVEQKVTDSGQKVWDGNKTEQGLLQFVVARLHWDYKSTRRAYSRDAKKQWPFNSSKKRMTTMVLSEGRSRIFIKGAPESLLCECTAYMNASNEEVSMTPEARAILEKSITTMASQGNRVLLFAKCDTSHTAIPDAEPEVDGLTCIALLGISDPIRPEVPAAVRQCQESGIMVRMVTGDNMLTAQSIARQCGIYQDGGLVMEGRQFRELVEQIPADNGHESEAFKDITERLQVLARSSPEDKQTLAQLLQEAGMVVAVTGDGTNDGPALKMADVGFSMNTGTDVAKSASDIVLMDDNFVSVVKAAMWGRNVNDNIKKFLQFQVTVNIMGVLITFLGAVSDQSNQSPLTPVQLLWLNLIMDTLAALALATEQPVEEQLLSRQPEPPDASLFTPRMWVNIIGHALFQIPLLLWLLTSGHELLGLENRSLEHLTVYFNTLILLQIWNQFNARKLHGETNVFEGFLENSRPHAAITLVMCAFQYIAVEHLGPFMGTTPLSLNEWLFCIGVGFLCIPYGFILNQLPILQFLEPNRFEAGLNNVAAAETVPIAESGDRTLQYRKDGATAQVLQSQNRRNGQQIVKETSKRKS